MATDDASDSRGPTCEHCGQFCEHVVPLREEHAFGVPFYCDRDACCKWGEEQRTLFEKQLMSTPFRFADIDTSLQLKHFCLRVADHCLNSPCRTLHKLIAAFPSVYSLAAEIEQRLVTDELPEQCVLGLTSRILPGISTFEYQITSTISADTLRDAIEILGVYRPPQKQKQLQSRYDTLRRKLRAVEPRTSAEAMSDMRQVETKIVEYLQDANRSYPDTFRLELHLKALRVMLTRLN